MVMPPTSGVSFRNRRSRQTNLQESASMRMVTSCPSPSCCRSRGFCPQIYDGAETQDPTSMRRRAQGFWREISEIVVAYIKALMEANELEMRKNPKLAVEKIVEWTKINKEVVYIFLGPVACTRSMRPSSRKWVEAVSANLACWQKPT